MAVNKVNNESNHPFSNTGVNLPSKRIDYILSIDWLSLSYKFISSPNLPVNIELLKFSTSIFNICELYSLSNKPICTVFRSPKSSILPPDSAIVKFENYLLYDKSFFLNLSNYLTLLKIINPKINRIDICCDFQSFRYKLLPADFINKFLKNSIIKRGKSKYAAIGSASQSVSHEYLRFGSRSSFVSSYLYNKSLEFRERKEKSYIKEIWQLNGFNLESDVWRLEFSLSGFNTQLLSKESGEVFLIDHILLSNNKYLLNLFQALVSKYFSFVKKGTQVHMKDKVEIKLFDFERMRNIRLMKVNYTKDQSKYNKIIINEMVQNFTEFKKEDDLQRSYFESFMYSYAKEFNLIDYLYHKLQIT